MTARGADLLRTELQRLKTENRPRIIQAISEAREHGDLKENAEYHAAREQQGFTEGRIRHIENQLSCAQIIDIRAITPTGRVIFGATVKLLNLVTLQRVTYVIVGDEESNIQESRVSLSSPLARSLIGKETGETVVVKTPGGSIEYEIEVILHI